MEERRTSAPVPDLPYDPGPVGPGHDPREDVRVTGPRGAGGVSSWMDYVRWFFDPGIPPDWSEYFPELRDEEYEEEVEVDPDAELDLDEIFRRAGADPRDRGDGTRYYFPEDELEKEARRLASAPPPPPPPVRKKKRARVGGKPFWQKILDNLAAGLNPLTGLPWNINPLTGEPWQPPAPEPPPPAPPSPAPERRTVARRPGTDDDDTVDDDGDGDGDGNGGGRDDGKLDRRRTYATGEGPGIDDDETPAERTKKKKRPKVGRKPLPPDLDLVELMYDCPPPTLEELERRGLGGLVEVAPNSSQIAELQAGLRNGIDVARRALEATAERIVQPAVMKAEIDDAIATWPQRRSGLIEAARRKYRAEGGQDWDTGKWLSLSKALTERRTNVGLRRATTWHADAYYRSAWNLQQETMRHERMRDVAETLRSTRSEERMRLGEKLAGELAALDEVAGGIGRLGVAGADSADPRAKGLEVWRRRCRLALLVRGAEQTRQLAETAEAAILVWERHLDAQSGGSFFGTNLNRFLYGTQDAPERMARALTNLVDLESNADPGIDERALLQKWETLKALNDNIREHRTDNQAVAEAMEEVHGVASWLTDIGKDLVLSIASAGAVQALRTAYKVGKGAAAAASGGRAGARVSGAPERIYTRIHDDFEKVAESGRVWGRTEGSVYGMASKDASRLRSMSRKPGDDPGLIVWEGRAAEHFRPHPVEGPYSLMKRLLGQYKSGLGDLVFEPGAVIRTGKTIRVLAATLGEHAMQSRARAQTRLWGRRVGEWLLPYSVYRGGRELVE